MPIDMSGMDDVLKNVYSPALEQQVNERLLIDKLGWKAPEYVPFPRWKRILLTSRERLNSAYMHLRYGECDDLRSWNDHVC